MEMIASVAQIIIIIMFLAVAFRGFLHRNMPRVGGKIGRRVSIDPATPVPGGYSGVYGRMMTLFKASSEATHFADLKTFLRHGTVGQPTVMQIYRVAVCKTEIEMPATVPDYERIDAEEALALLRELPDPRFIRRLHLSDERSFLDPWARKIAGPQFFLLGNATNFSLVVLYRPDRRQRELVGLTLLHEWLHLVAFGSSRHLRRFEHANVIEPLAPAEVEPVSFGVRNTPLHEAWCDLGEKLFGYDDAIARDAALKWPVHAMILWQRIEKVLRKTPRKLRSTRFVAFEARAAFMHGEVMAKRRETLKARR